MLCCCYRVLVLLHLNRPSLPMEYRKYFFVMCIACLVTTAAFVILYESHTNNGLKADSGAGRIDPRGIINPGCRERTLETYIPVKTEKCYHHPSIVHYAKFHRERGGSLSLTFIEYLSMLSTYKVLQPEIIFLHSNGRFVGKYWDITQTWTNTIVKVNPVKNFTHFGKVKLGFIEHNADYAKLSQVLKHGGVATDFDVIMSNATKLHEWQSVSECVVAQETTGIRISFFSCMKDSPYMRAIVDSYHKNYKPAWVYNAGVIPTDLLLKKGRKDCFNVYVDTEICNPDYTKAREQWLKPHGVKWRPKIANHYFKRLLGLSDEDMLKTNSSLNEMLHSVLLL